MHAQTMHVRIVLLLASIVQAATQCITNLDEIADMEKKANLSQQRTYDLCPNRKYNVALLDLNNNFVKGQRPISAGPNMRVRCGNNGRLENNCVIQGGHLHIDVTTNFGANYEAQNVVFEGITFADTKRYMVWGNKPGKITFIDCEFKVGED